MSLTTIYGINGIGKDTIVEELIKRNYIKDIYEANLYKNQSFETLKKTLQDDKVKIKYLCGNTTKY